MAEPRKLGKFPTILLISLVVVAAVAALATHVWPGGKPAGETAAAAASHSPKPALRPAPRPVVAQVAAFTEAPPLPAFKGPPLQTGDQAAAAGLTASPAADAPAAPAQ
jgi:hypothetical protein